MEKIAFLGPKATFCDLAATKLFDNSERVAYRTIPECIDAADKNEVDYAVVPLENALEGSVNITMDYLIHEVRVPIVAEFSSPIRQHLMMHPNHVDKIGEIEQIYSHSHAIAHCLKYLHGELKLVRCENTTSTASAAQYVSEHPEIVTAAIANEMAAREYGLTIVKSDIHDYAHNHTRFVVLSHKTLRERRSGLSRSG